MMWINNYKQTKHILSDTMALKNISVILELCLNDHHIDKIVTQTPHFIDFFLKFNPEKYQNTLEMRKKKLKITLMEAIFFFKTLHTRKKIDRQTLKQASKYIKLIAKIC